MCSRPAVRRGHLGALYAVSADLRAPTPNRTIRNRRARHDAPTELREGMEDNLRTLVVEQLAAINLRLMTKAAPDDRFLGPRAESFCLPRDEP